MTLHDALGTSSALRLLCALRLLGDSTPPSSSFHSKEITMSHLLHASVRERPDIAAQPVLAALPASLRHVGLIDRLSLSVGLWLVVHSAAHAHAHAHIDREAHATLLRLVREREARDLAVQRERWPH